MSIIKKRKKGVNIVKQNPELKYKKYFKRILKRKSKSQGFPRNQILTAHSICGFYSKENKCLSYNEIS